MKIAIITDTHWGARNDSLHFIDYYEKFYRDTFFPTLDKEKITTVLMLGDTFDRRKYINFVTWSKAKRIYFDELAKRNIQTHILVGNHDTSYKNTNEVNSPELLLREYDNINVIDSPQTIHLDYENDSDDVLMVPWICPENYDLCMDEIKNSKAKLCMGHFEIAGFAMHRGMPAGEGLDGNIFRNYDLVCSGHFHHKSSNNSIHYLGNPYELTWQDYNDARGFHIFDLPTRGLDFIANPNVMFHRVVYDDKLETIAELINKDLSKYTGTYVKVVVANKTNPYLFDQFMNRLYLVNTVDITIVEDAIDLTDGEESDTIDQAEDTITIINKYVDTLNNDGIDNNKLKSMMRELYVEALNLEQA